jgi:ABC-type amino acid transport substrate-binding protein
MLPYAAATRIGRPALADAIDRALAHMRDSGQIDAIITRGFASAVWTPPARPAILAA